MTRNEIALGCMPAAGMFVVRALEKGDLSAEQAAPSIVTCAFDLADEFLKEIDNKSDRKARIMAPKES